MLDEGQVERIASRGGVIGLILAQHQLEDGLTDGEGLAHTVRTLRSHIDEIHSLAGSYDHIGIGSDLDGFIEPTMPEIGRAEDLSKLVRPLADHYGPDVADAILYRNAARVVRHALAMREA